MKTLRSVLGHIWNAHTFSPTGIATRALLLSVLYGISEVLGLREYTTFLSGTSANLNISWETGASIGVIHLLLYVSFILLIPILLITAALLFAYNRWLDQKKARLPCSMSDS